MQKLYNFFLSKVLNKKVFDEYNEYIGKLSDMYVITEESFPRIIGYKIKKDGDNYNYEFKSIEFLSGDENEDKIIIKVRGCRDIIPRSFSYLLSKNLLDKQIVDINGKKLVRVNDLRLAEMGGELKVIAVDTGASALARRLGVEKMFKALWSIVNKELTDTLIMWDNVESLEMVNDNLKLSVPYKKLSKLHPADIADILEELDAKYRTKIFESLDENLAADTLEEIDPEVQADILENLSETKTAEVLDNMPNDEIADLLDEVDPETAEKIFINLEKEDAEEIRVLMEYAEETVGSIMNKDFISFNIDISAGETLEILRETNPEDEVAYNIYITDNDGKLQGVVTLKNLVFSQASTSLKDIMYEDVIKISHNENIDEAIDVSVKYNLYSLPVVDDEDKLCGIVVMNDIIDEILVPAWKKRFRKIG